MSGRALLTVSGVISPNLRGDIESGRRPRADYLAIADAVDGDLIDHAEARRDAGRLVRLLGRVLGVDFLLAVACWRRRDDYEVIVTDGENVGLPYAALTLFVRRRPAHLMIGHRMSARKKVLVHRVLGLRRRVDRLLVYASAQQRFAVQNLGYSSSSVDLHHFMVDTEFWSPRRSDAQRVRPMLCAVGQELRDYPTLVSAIDGLPVDLVIAAASPWSRRPDTSAGVEATDNVTVGAFDQYALRDLYARSDLVVVPLQATDFQAGITAILEGMAMALPIVCTRTEGQTDTLIDGVTGVYVPPNDAEAMRRAITQLLADPAIALQQASAARQWACDRAELTVYAHDIAGIVDQLALPAQRSAG